MHCSHKGKKQIINWWTDQIFVYLSIMRSAQRIDLKEAEFFQFLFYILFMIPLCIRAATGFANEFGRRLCDLQNFISITNIP